MRPYFDFVPEAFGPAQLIFGSDWLVCVVAADYARWHEFVCGCARSLAPDEREAIMGGTAAAIYRLES